MDFKKIFIKGASPTKIGGQAVLEGIMMKGEDRTAVVVRGAKGHLYIKTEKLPKRSRAAEIPIVRGVYIFVTTLMTGMKTLIYSAEILEKFEDGNAAEMQEKSVDGNAAETKEKSEDGNAAETKGQLEYGSATEVHDQLNDGNAAVAETPAKEGQQNQNLKQNQNQKQEKKDEGGIPFGVMIALSVAIAIAFVVGIFIIVPTVVVNFLGAYTDNAVALNLFEGLLRIVLFVVYIAIVSRMKDIQTTFEFHGAEHKTIHCFESGQPLTTENASRFETLHPRCGTSFLMFVMIIALLLFSLLGWPNLAIRIASRIVFIPLIAGLSYELLRYAGNSDTLLVRILSIPGLLLQKITTGIPDAAQLEVAIAALKAVIVPSETPEIEGFCDDEGRLLPDEDSIEYQSAIEGHWV